MRKGEKMMDREIVNMYEQMLKQQIMASICNTQSKTLKDITRELIEGNHEQYLNINYAYINVKHEIIGSYGISI